MKVFNLAEELEKERKKNKELESYREGYRKEIDYWRIQYSDLKDRIDKAIYYIELDMYGTALDILKGSDNNDK